MVHHIQQRRETAIVIVATFVWRTHKDTVFAHEDSRKIHRRVNAVRRAIGLKTIDADLRRRVQIPAGLSPQRLDVTVIAFCFATEQLVSTFSSGGVKIDTGAGATATA